MSGFFQNLLKDAAGGFFGSEYLRDYTHASKAFRTNLYQNSPKLKFLFHCYFNINTDVYGAGIPPENFSILVRDVKLPSYNIQTAQLNQYNRKRIVQTKIKYDPVTFSFFDDNGNTIANLWKAYYNYYYNDGTIPTVSFTGNKRGGPGQDLGSANQAGTVTGLRNQTQGGSVNNSRYYDRNIYQPSITGNANWGYNSSAGQNTKPAFFKDITVFGFYQKNFIAYTLINPVITSFAHDTYNYEESAGIMKNNMTIDYETVVYNEGAMQGSDPSKIVTGFATDNYYDKRLSPIAQPGSNNTILGQGGLVDAVSGTLSSLSKGNLLGAIKTAGTAYKTFKNTNIKQTLKNELKTGLINSLNATPNSTRNTPFGFPNNASGPTSASNASAPTVDTVGGTSAAQNNNATKGTAYQVNPNGSVVNYGSTNTAIPQNQPAGKQSNTGGSVNLPPTQQDVNTVFQNNLFG